MNSNSPISLHETTEYLSLVGDGLDVYLNTQTGEFVTVSRDDRDLLNQGADASRLAEWQVYALDEIKKVLASPDYCLLPQAHDINQYEIMEAFCESLSNKRISEALLEQIRGKGAFQRFKNALDFYGVRQQWYKFKYQALQKIALEWLEEKNLAYKE